MEHGFNWLQVLPGFKSLPIHVAGSIVVLIFIAILVLAFRLSFKKSKDYTIPSERCTLHNILELAYEGIMNLLKTVIGEKEGPQFFPLIGGTFIYIFISNLLGIIPGLTPPTDNINTNLASSIIVLVATHYYGIKVHKFGYIKHFTGPLWWLAIVFVPIELITHFFARPLSLSMRLYGNMLGDHTVLSIFSSLVPFLVPIVFLGLGVFVSFMQAFIFSLLTMLYLGGSIAHEH